MILEKHYLQTVHEWTKSYIELIALYVHPKNNNHLRSHLRAIMALDHSRLGLESKFWGNKSGRIFCVWLVYFTKSCQQIWGRVNQRFIHFQIKSEVKQYYEALLLSYRPRTNCSISQFCNTNCTHSILKTIEARTRGLSAKPFNFQNHLYGQPVLTFDKRHICSASCEEEHLNKHK